MPPFHSGEQVGSGSPGSILPASSKALSVTANSTREIILNICVAVRGPWPGVYTMGLDSTEGPLLTPRGFGHRLP